MQPAPSPPGRESGKRCKLPRSVWGRAPAAKRFLAFYRCQIAFPGISKASSYAMSHYIIFYDANFFPTFRGRGMERVRPLRYIYMSVL